ncbi:MAG: hypothetical protein ABEJ70_07195 [Halobacteriaceae archaeon]
MERETVVEVGLAIAAVVLFIAVVLAVGATFGGQRLSVTGGQALVGAIVFFIVVMAATGFWLSTQKF